MRSRLDAGFGVLAGAAFFALLFDGLVEHLVGLAGFLLAGVGLSLFHGSGPFFVVEDAACLTGNRCATR